MYLSIAKIVRYLCCVTSPIMVQSHCDQRSEKRFDLSEKKKKVNFHGPSSKYPKSFKSSASNRVLIPFLVEDPKSYSHVSVVDYGTFPAAEHRRPSSAQISHSFNREKFRN